MPHFETFNRNLPRTKEVPKVTILRSGMLSLNKSAYLALGSPVAVELMYDAEEQIVGLHPVAPSVDSAYIVRRPAHGSSGPFLITALAFTKFYEIDTSESLRWDASIIRGVLCIRLVDEATAVTSNRAGTKRPAVAAPKVVPLRAADSAKPQRRNTGLTGSA